MADVTVTVVLFNSAHDLQTTLVALHADLEAGNAELVAVDNASPDDSAAVVARLAPQARVIRSETNRGFAGGCNLAWPHVSARYWLLLNPDAAPEPGAVRALVDFMDRDPGLAAASAWLREPGSGRVLFPGRAFPSASRTLFELSRLHMLLPQHLRSRLLQGPYVQMDDRPRPEPDWIPGTAMIVRADAIREVGLLDEAFFLYGEDLEWCWRMRRAGWRIDVADDAVVEHGARTSGERTWSSDAVEQRIAVGMLAACRRMRGPLRARLTALASVAAYTVEARHPRRSAEQRALAARARRAWWRALRNA